MSATQDEILEKSQAIEQLNHEIGLLFRRARKFGVDRARELDPSLSGTSYQLLVFLHTRGPHRAQQLVEMFDLDKGAVSRYVQQLADLGLVDRTPDPTDKRATIVAISDEARRRIDEIGTRRMSEIDRLLGDWSSEKVRNLAEALADYNRALD